MTTNGNVPSTWDEARQLGQLFMMGFDGTTVNDQIKLLIEHYHVGSILLTAKNLESTVQTTQLILDLQTIARNSGHPVPLLIVIDQENGGVNSLFDEQHIRQFPSAMGVAATGNKQMARYIARATAQELSSCGFNWILGPVLDVLTNAKAQPLGVRSLGEDPQEVASFGVEQIKGYQEGGLATCGKHFPSYGNLEFFGSLNDVPTITDSVEQLSQSALVPFRAAIAGGLDAMMVGGVAMTSNHMNVMHACLSEQICKELLRDEMKFQGVIVSECLEMEALSRNIGISGGTVMACKAGCDLLLTCRSLSVQEEAINGLRAGLDNGMIERYRVQESCARILTLKNRYVSWEKAFNPPGIENLNRLQPLHSKLSVSAYNNSITVMRDSKQHLAFLRNMKPDEEVLLLTPLVKALPASSAFRQPISNSRRPSSQSPNTGNHTNASLMAGEMVFQLFGRSLAQKRSGKIAHTSYTANGVRPQHESLAERAGAVIVLTADAGRNKYQVAFAKHIAMLCRLGTYVNGKHQPKPCIVIAVSSPFDFNSDTSIDPYICTYDFTETALQALVRVLCGDIKPAGGPAGISGRARRQSAAHQQWLVEPFKEERDSHALDALLTSSQTHSKAWGNLLRHTSYSTFLLRSDQIDEAHFVVRNSSTRELLGFCATYFYKSDNIGYIGAILVDPARRQQSIGHSLHDRAMRSLLQKPSIAKVVLGTRLPNVFLGIPKPDPAEHKRMRQWFSKLGWNVSHSRPVCRMAIKDLTTWSAPEGLGQALNNPEVKYDLVHGAEHADSILVHVSRNAGPDVQYTYNMALNNKEGCAIIRAKRLSDGAILATLLLYRSQSKLSAYIPQIQNREVVTGGISFPVLSSDVADRAALLQGLILLSVRQLKKQGIVTLLLNYMDDAASIPGLGNMGFVPTDDFDVVQGDPSSWSALAAT